MNLETFFIVIVLLPFEKRNFFLLNSKLPSSIPKVKLLIFTFFPLFKKISSYKQMRRRALFLLSFFIIGIPVPAALNPIIGSLILLSHSFLNFCASFNLLVYF